MVFETISVKLVHRLISVLWSVTDMTVIQEQS